MLALFSLRCKSLKALESMLLNLMFLEFVLIAKLDLCLASVTSPAQDSLGDILSLPNAKADTEPLEDQAG